MSSQPTTSIGRSHLAGEAALASFARRMRTLCALWWCALLTGCGYMVGAPYDPQVRTVEVPIFDSKSNRRGIEVQLTEAVHKQIQLRTPFRLVKDGGDTRLTGRIVDVRKNVLGETRFDDPRELQINLALEVGWEDVRAGRVLAQEQIPLSSDLVSLRSQAEFAPEVGQSLATATQQAVDRMALQIVDLMESPW
jgi:hypothetical protein